MRFFLSSLGLEVYIFSKYEYPKKKVPVGSVIE